MDPADDANGTYFGFDTTDTSVTTNTVNTNKNETPDLNGTNQHQQQIDPSNPSPLTTSTTINGTDSSKDAIDDFFDRHQSDTKSRHFKSESKIELIRNKFFLNHNYYNIYNSNRNNNNDNINNNNNDHKIDENGNNDNNYDKLFDDLESGSHSHTSHIYQNGHTKSSLSTDATSSANMANINDDYNENNNNNNNNSNNNNSNNYNSNNNNNNNRPDIANDTSNDSSQSNYNNSFTNANLYHNLRAMSKPSPPSNGNYGNNGIYSSFPNTSSQNNSNGISTTKHDYNGIIDEKWDDKHSIDNFGPIVVDNGSFRIKAGFMSDTSNIYDRYDINATPVPSVVIPNIMGRKIQYGRKKRRKHSSKKLRIPLIGDEAQMKRESCDITHPIENGIIKNWDDIQTVWSYVFFTKLNISHCEDYPVLMTESPFNTIKNRNMMSEIMFETFNVPKLAIAMDAILELYHTGQTTGVSVSSGYGSTNIIPIYEGIPVSQAFNSLNIAGSTVTDNLQKLLYENDHLLMTSSHREIAREIKEKIGFVSLDYLLDSKTDSKHIKEYQLPDESIISVHNERFECTEPLFYPNLIGINDIDGIHTLIDDSITQSHKDMKSMLYKNIVLTGGNTLFPGFQKRLSMELEGLNSNDINVSHTNNNNNNSNNTNNTNQIINGTITSSINKPHKNGMNLHGQNISLSRIKNTKPRSKININIRATPERKYAAWIGGSVIASLESLNGMWVSKEDYEEYGSDIIHRKVLSAV